jgi:hypothetical protein
MASISELRQRSKLSKELQEEKAKRVKEVVSSVIDSSSFTLTAMNHGADMSDKSADELVGRVADEVTKVITDPRNEFIDACRARGLKPSRIRTAVEQISNMFDLEPNGDYDAKLEAVSIFIKDRPSLYDDIALLR